MRVEKIAGLDSRFLFSQEIGRSSRSEDVRLAEERESEEGSRINALESEPAAALPGVETTPVQLRDEAATAVANDAVVIELFSRPPYEDPDLDYPSERPEVIRAQSDLDRAADFLEAAGLVASLDAANESDESGEPQTISQLENSPNISRIGSEVSGTQPLSDKGVRAADSLPDADREVQPITRDVAANDDTRQLVEFGEEAGEKNEAEKEQERAEASEIQELKQRDQEVRSHEQAHKSVLGQFAAGGIQLQYTRGPNGAQYAVAGSVPVDLSEEAEPEETLRKAQTIRRAALAPAEPSSADRQVAAQASQLEAKARAEVNRTREEELNGEEDGGFNSAVEGNRERGIQAYRQQQNESEGSSSFSGMNIQAIF